MAGLSFVELQNSVIANGFDESQRDDVKNWINFRYGWVWALEEWTFRLAAATVTVTAGSQTVGGLPADFAIAEELQRPDGCPLDPLDPSRFYRRYYNTTSTVTGTPEAFTDVAGTVLVGPTPDTGSSAYQLLYLRSIAHKDKDGNTVAGPLDLDTDVPMLPEEFHMSLVHGGKAEGLKLVNVPLWQSFEQDFNSAIETMRKSYLANIDGWAGAYPADRLR